ncbi:hypothetical protein FHR67_002322 [Xanthomonas arboricola]|nr:hypothetical protein [Xanthomonas campestris]
MVLLRDAMQKRRHGWHAKQIDRRDWQRTSLDWSVPFLRGRRRNDVLL